MSATDTNQPASTTMWEGGFAAIKFGFERIKQDPAFFLLYLGVSVVISIITQANAKSGGGSGLSLLMSFVFLVAYTRYCLNQSAPKASPIAETFRTTTQEYLRMLGSFLLAIALAVASLFTLFISLIWVLPWLVMLPFIVLDQQVGVMEAFRRSRALTRTNKGKIWGVTGISIGLGAISGILNVFPGIGPLVWLVVITVITTSATIGYAKLYRFLKV